MKDSKKELLAKFNKDIIIKASRELFDENGIDKTTMDQIAKKADCSKSTIYVYFKSKEEIYNNILYQNMCSLRDSVQNSISKNETFKTNFFALCSSMVKFQESYPEYFESLTQKIEVSDEAMKNMPVLKDIYTAGEEINQSLINMLESAIKDGIVHNYIEPLPTVFSLWGEICGVISIAYKKEQYIQSCMKKTKKEFLDYSFRLLYHSIAK